MTRYRIFPHGTDSFKIEQEVKILGFLKYWTSSYSEYQDEEFLNKAAAERYIDTLLRYEEQVRETAEAIRRHKEENPPYIYP